MLFYYTVHVRFFATYNPTSLRLNKLGVANGSWYPYVSVSSGRTTS